MKHVSIDFAGVHTATREIIGVGIGSVGFFNFMTDDSGHDGTGGSRCNSICKKLLLLVFSCVDVANEKTSSTIYRRLSTFNALVFMVYTWIQAPRYKIHFNVAERREPIHAVWLPDNIDQLLGTAWMLAWKYAHFTIRWIGSKGI